MTEFFTVNKSLCRKDGICALVCPTKVIAAEKGDYPHPGQGAICLKCGQCMAFCPTGAIRAGGFEPGQAIDYEVMPKGRQADLLLKTRRSVRVFKKEPLARPVLDSLMTTASYAPTAGNQRLLRFVVLYEAARLKDLGNLIAEMIEKHPDLSRHAFRPEGQGEALVRSWRNGVDVFFRGAPHLVAVVSPKGWRWGPEDGSICLSYLELAAWGHGIGACWAGFITLAAEHFPAVRDFLKMNPDEKMIGGQMLGLPVIKPAALAPRVGHPVTWLG